MRGNISAGKTLALIAAALTTAGLCYRWKTADRGGPPLPGKIEALLAQGFPHVFNGVLLVAKGRDTLCSKAMGFADIGQQKPLMPDTRFVIGSISKQVTAVVILREFEKGTLALDEPIRYYLPELAQPWADTVTVHHLLTHTHGTSSLNGPSVFKAGSRFDYNLSNHGYDLLARIAERVSDRSFAALSQELFDRCGMKHTIHPGRERCEQLAQGYTEGADAQLGYESNSFENAPAAGGFISTAGDLLLWNQHLHRGTLLQPDTYERMITPAENALRQHLLFGETRYGYGITTDTREGLTQLGQTGFAPGFVSMNFYYPESGTSVIVLQNVSRHGDDWKKKFYYPMQVRHLVREMLLSGS